MMLCGLPRLRHQDGWVESRGKKRKYWYGHYFVRILVAGKEKRRHKGKFLGYKSYLTKTEAELKLRVHIQKSGGTVSAKGDDQESLKWFVETKYIPLREGNWREDSTAATNKQLIQAHIVTPLGSKRLADMDKVILQSHVNALAKKYSDSVVRHTRNFLKSIFDEAIDQGFLDKDPARKLKMPITREVAKPVLEWEQLQAVLGRLSEEKLLLITIGMIDALRPGELFALRWKGFQSTHFEISETVYRGKLRPFAKTKKSAGKVAIPPKLAERVEEWKKSCPDPSPEAFIFPNTQGGFISVYNFQNRVLNKIKEDLKELGIHLPKLNFQVLRRSFATRAQKHGSLKDIQGQMRHAKPDVTAEEYMQVVPASVMQMVEAMYEVLMTEEGTVQ